MYKIGDKGGPVRLASKKPLWFGFKGTSTFTRRMPGALIVHELVDGEIRLTSADRHVSSARPRKLSRTLSEQRQTSASPDVAVLEEAVTVVDIGDLKTDFVAKVKTRFVRGLFNIFDVLKSLLRHKTINGWNPD